MNKNDRFAHDLHDYQPRMDLVAPLALRVAVIGLVGAILFTASAFAHHPGSHAWRQGDGRVKLEAIVAGPASNCIMIGAVTTGSPAGQAAPTDAYPVSVRLRDMSDGKSCLMTVRTLKDETLLVVPANVKRLHLFVIAVTGQIASTERVTIN